MHPKSNTHTGSHLSSTNSELGLSSLLQRENTYAYLLGCFGK